MKFAVLVAFCALAAAQHPNHNYTETPKITTDPLTKCCNPLVDPESSTSCTFNSTAIPGHHVMQIKHLNPVKHDPTMRAPYHCAANHTNAAGVAAGDISSLGCTCCDCSPVA